MSIKGAFDIIKEEMLDPAVSDGENVTCFNIASRSGPLVRLRFNRLTVLRKFESRGKTCITGIFPVGMPTTFVIDAHDKLIAKALQGDSGMFFGQCGSGQD